MTPETTLIASVSSAATLIVEDTGMGKPSPEELGTEKPMEGTEEEFATENPADVTEKQPSLTDVNMDEFID